MPRTVDIVKESLPTDYPEGSGSGSGDRKKPIFMKFAAGKNYRVRPIGRIVEFYKIFKNGRSVVVDEKDAKEAARIVSEKDGKTVYAQRRWAVNVFDRSDDVLKILEGSRPLFDSFSTWSSTTEIHIGAKNAGDWVINVKGEKKQRRYNASYLTDVEITEEEYHRAKKEENGGKGEAWNLDEVFKEVPLDKVIPYIFGSDDSDSGSSNEIDTSSSSGEAVPAGVGTDEDFEF